MRPVSGRSIAHYAALLLLAGCAKQAREQSPAPKAQPSGGAVQDGSPATEAMIPPGGEATDSPWVGKHAGDFSLKDSTGREVNLKALLKSGNVILMFYKGLW